MRFYANRDVSFQLDRILNGGIEFTDNIRGGFVEFVTNGGEQAIDHNLGFVPIGWIVIYKSGPVDIYAGGTPWNSRQLFLVSNATNVKVRLFVM